MRETPFPSIPPGAAVMGKEEQDAVLEVVMERSPFRHYGPGRVGRARQLEKEPAQFVGTKHALAVTSGTAALKVAPAAFSVSPGDEVIVPAYTWIACPSAVALCGAITTDDETIFERAVAYHDLGFLREQFEIDHPRLTPGFGENYRMSDLAAAVALAQLGKLESAVLAPLWAHKAYLREALRNEPGIQLRRLPDETGDAGTSLVFFAPTAEGAAWMSEALMAENIPVSRPYGGKVLYQARPSHSAFETDASLRTTQHLTPQLSSIEYHQGMCPRSEELIARTLILNPTPVLTEQDTDDAVIAIRKVAHAVVKP